MVFLELILLQQVLGLSADKSVNEKSCENQQMHGDNWGRIFYVGI
jgi:hypothetical protein